MLVVGKKGHGKTSLARAIAARAERVVVLDPMADFGGGAVGCGAACAAWLRAHRQLRRYSLICRPVGSEDEAAFWQVWWGPEAGGCMTDCLLVVDEVDRWCSPSYTEPALRHLIHYGRHQAVSLVATCRRPANTGRDLSSQADAIVAFRVDEPRDVDHLARYMDVRGLDSLPPRQYIASAGVNLLRGV